MQLRLDKLTIAEINELPRSNVSIKIERFGASIDRLEALNSRFASNAIPIVLSVDGREHSDEIKVVGLDVLRILTSARDVIVNAVLTVPIEDIDQISFVRDLSRLCLRGYFKKKIKLDLIEKFHNLVEFEFEEGLNKEQLGIVNKLTKLRALSVAHLDVSGLSRSENIQKIKVGQSLSSPQLLADRVPQLVELDIEKCKDQSDFSFVLDLNKISSLTFRYMKNMRDLYLPKNPEKLKTLQFVGASNLQNVEFLEQAETLENLLITDLKGIEVEDFFALKKMKFLKHVYITFKDPNKNVRIRKFIESEGWLYRQPGL